MNPLSPTVSSPREVLALLASYRRRWLVPAAALTALAVLYAMVRPGVWEASQALVLRNEAAGNEEAVGKFAQPEHMKTVQETLLELARSPRVLSGTLEEVGPPAGYRGGDHWPTPDEVAELREAVKLVPPKGAEFGKTEVFYIKVRDRDRRRAVALASALCTRLESEFQSLRDARAKSMVDELEKAVHLASADLHEATKCLAQIETEVGSDLAELRLLCESNAGESALRRSATEIRNELRQAQAALKSNEELLSLLGEARATPGRLVALPQPLLESQPALRRLKDGLIDAQLSAAQLQGRMSDQHPLVIAARTSQAEIDRRLAEELDRAMANVQADLRMNRKRVAMLEAQLAGITGQLNRLAAIRAPYANQVAETRKRSELLERAVQRLADARASRATARAANLLTRLDAPDAGARPVGPGPVAIVLAGLAGGLAVGFGVVFLTVPSPLAVTVANGTCRVHNTNGHSQATPLKAALKRLSNPCRRG
jgi:uncharacterized protein involved in exopolysaccharide biosynthesis